MKQKGGKIKRTWGCLPVNILSTNPIVCHLKLHWAFFSPSFCRALMMTTHPLLISVLDAEKHLLDPIIRYENSRRPQDAKGEKCSSCTAFINCNIQTWHIVSTKSIIVQGFQDNVLTFWHPKSLPKSTATLTGSIYFFNLFVLRVWQHHQ